MNLCMRKYFNKFLIEYPHWASSLITLNDIIIIMLFLVRSPGGTDTNSPPLQLTRKTAIDRFKLIHICQFAMRLENNHAPASRFANIHQDFQTTTPLCLCSINRFFLFSIRERRLSLLNYSRSNSGHTLFPDDSYK